MFGPFARSLLLLCCTAWGGRGDGVGAEGCGSAGGGVEPNS